MTLVDSRLWKSDDTTTNDWSTLECECHMILPPTTHIFIATDPASTLTYARCVISFINSGNHSTDCERQQYLDLLHLLQSEYRHVSLGNQNTSKTMHLDQVCNRWLNLPYQCYQSTKAFSHLAARVENILTCHVTLTAWDPRPQPAPKFSMTGS